MTSVFIGILPLKKKELFLLPHFFSVFFRLQLQLMATYFILWVIIQCYYFRLLFKLLHPLEAPTSWLPVRPCPIISQRLPSFLVPWDVPTSFDSVNIFECPLCGMLRAGSDPDNEWSHFSQWWFESSCPQQLAGCSSPACARMLPVMGSSPHIKVDRASR